MPNLEVTPEPGRLACEVCVWYCMPPELCTLTGIKTRQTSVWQLEPHTKKQPENLVDCVTINWSGRLKSKRRIKVPNWIFFNGLINSESYVQGPNSWSNITKRAGPWQLLFPLLIHLLNLRVPGGRRDWVSPPPSSFLSKLHAAAGEGEGPRRVGHAIMTPS